MPANLSELAMDLSQSAVSNLVVCALNRAISVTSEYHKMAAKFVIVRITTAIWVEFAHFVSWHPAYYPNPNSNPNSNQNPNPNPVP